MEKILQKIKQLPKDKKISILPHDNIDIDSIFSSILLSKLLNWLKIENEILVFDSHINKENQYFLDKVNFDIEKCKVRYEDQKRLLFLVDHYETSHKGEVVACIDHHYTTKNICYDIYLYKSTSSASYIIYELMKKDYMQITKEIVSLVAYATMTDTCSFTSTRSNPVEKQEILSLLDKYCLDTESMLKDSLCIQDISKMPIKDIIYNGVKDYNFNSHCVKASYIQIDTLEVSTKIIDEIFRIVKNEKIDMWVFIVFDMIKQKSKVFYIKQDCIKTKTLNLIVSRGQDIMPKIEEMFN